MFAQVRAENHVNLSCQGSIKTPHTVCSRCRGQDCTRLLTCNECASWLELQWVEYENKKEATSQGSIIPTPFAENSTLRTDNPFGGLTADKFWRAERFVGEAGTFSDICSHSCFW